MTTPPISRSELFLISYNESSARFESDGRIKSSPSAERLLFFYNSPVGVVSSQLRLMPGALVARERLFHLFEVGLDIFLYLREDLNSPE